MRKKRALVLAGAGASIDFGAPSTDELTDSIEAKLLSDPLMRECGGDRAWTEIRDTLSEYYDDGRHSPACSETVNFEHIYHCVLLRPSISSHIYHCVLLSFHLRVAPARSRE